MQHYFISTKHPKRYSLKIVEEIIKSIPVVIQENNLRIRKRMKKKNILDPEKTFLIRKKWYCGAEFFGWSLSRKPLHRLRLPLRLL